MGFSITIDQGNSTAKVAVWNGGDLVAIDSFTDLSLTDLHGLIDTYGADKLIYSSVSKHLEQSLLEIAGKGITCYNLASGLPVPLKIDYSTPETLGSDRLAAAVGAATLHPGRELLVVDAGTAVTYDRITARGHFVGGNIAPGVGMRLKALNTFTARLPLISSRGETRLWGNSTEVAMRSGAIVGVVAEISYYRSRLPQDALMVISGGWGKEIASHLDFECDYQENLVNRGLNAILQYLEQD